MGLQLVRRTSFFAGETKNFSPLDFFFHHVHFSNIHKRRETAALFVETLSQILATMKCARAPRKFCYDYYFPQNASF